MKFEMFEDNNSQTVTKVALLGVTHNTNNYGVRVLLSGAVQGLTKAYKNVNISILDYGIERHVWTEETSRGLKNIPLINLRFSWRIYLPNNIIRLITTALIARYLRSDVSKVRQMDSNPWLRLIMDNRVCFSLNGGDSFSDIYGMRRFFYIVFPQILVLILGIPLIFLPQTYGPFNSRWTKLIAREILKRASMLCSRDVQGAALIKELFPKGEVVAQFVPDLGFDMSPEEVEEEIISKIKVVKISGPLVGVNISKLLYMGGYNGKNMFGLKEEYPKLITSLLEFLINELRVSVLLTPHVFGGAESQESELTLCRVLWENLHKDYGEKLIFLDHTFNHRQIKTIIGQCDLFVGSRMHACIAAISQNIPCVSLAYSDKFFGVIFSVSDTIPVVDLRKAKTNEVCNIVRDALLNRNIIRHQIEIKMPEIRQRICKSFQSETIQKFVGS